MLNHFVDSVLIIDDSQDEVKTLQQELSNKNIYSSFYTPEDLKKRGLINNHKLIFLDLHLNLHTSELKGHISYIRSILRDHIGKEFGSYGIVMWTQHTEEIETFKNKIQEDIDKYEMPLFILSLDKTKYLNRGFTTLFQDLENMIKNDLSALFFLEWYSIVKKAQDEVIRKVYEIFPDFSVRNERLNFLLKKMAKNYTHVNLTAVEAPDLHLNALNSFHEFLYSELLSLTPKSSDIKKLFGLASVETIDNFYTIAGLINEAMHIDYNNIDKNIILPGNVYLVLHSEPGFECNKFPAGAIKIVIEITPPCDFAQGKKSQSRFICGFIANYLENGEVKDYKCNSQNFYNQINPINIKIDNNSKDIPQRIIFDFLSIMTIKDDKIKDSSQYSLQFNIKSKLFADILQKFSSHAARIGVSMLQS